MLSTKDLVLKKRPVKKLIEKYVGLYVVKKIVSVVATTRHKVQRSHNE